MRNLITLFGMTVLILITCIVLYRLKYSEGLTAPNFNWDAGAGTRIQSQEWTQPQMIADVGLGNGNIAREQNEVYNKYKEGYIHNLYDYGNMFHIPTSTNDSSDTTEDNLQAFVLERSRFAKDISH